MQLTLWGYDCRACYDGQDALQTFFLEIPKLTQIRCRERETKVNW
jgi:hypothetical protein